MKETPLSPERLKQFNEYLLPLGFIHKGSLMYTHPSIENNEYTFDLSAMQSPESIFKIIFEQGQVYNNKRVLEILCESHMQLYKSFI